MSDERTTNKDKKLMDLLLCFFSDLDKQLLLQNVASFFFDHATGEDLCKYLKKFILDKQFNISRNQLICLSPGGTAINKKQYNLLDNAFSKFQLGPFFSFVLHLARHPQGLFSRELHPSIWINLCLIYMPGSRDNHAKKISNFWPKDVTCQHVIKLFF